MKEAMKEKKEVSHHSKISFDEIRAKVALEHDTLLGMNDPILMTVTLNELVFQRYVDILDEKNGAYRKSIDAALQKGIADAAAINETLNEVLVLIKKVKKSRKEFKKEVQKALLAIEAARKTRGR